MAAVGPAVAPADLRAAKGLASLVTSCSDAWLQAAAEASLQPSPGNVHRLRIATRRLRSALALCSGSVDRRLLRRARRSLRQPFRRAGRLRDLHVAAKHIRRHATGDAAVAATLATIRTASRDRGRRLQRSLRSGRRERVARRLAAVTAVLHQRPSRGSAYRGTVDRLQRRLASLAAGFHGASATAAVSGSPEDLHRARLALKRLRYATELAAGLVAGHPAGDMARLRPLQRRLGAIADLGVAAGLAPPGLRQQLLAAQRHATAAALPILAGQVAIPETGRGTRSRLDTPRSPR